MIEDVVRIDVVDLKLKSTGQKGVKLFSPGLTIVNEGKTLLSLDSLAGYSRLEVLEQNYRRRHGLSRHAALCRNAARQPS